MPDLQTKYMGLELNNPLIIGSSGLSNSVKKIKKLADNNVGAVVLKSLFEEQILIEAGKNIRNNQSQYSGAEEYIKGFTKAHYLSKYLQLIKDSKAAVDIPIIANINCVSDNDWTSFASEIEKAGADALELNIAVLPSSAEIKSADNEKKYFSIIKKVRSQLSIPVSLKMSYFSAGLAHLIQQLSYTGDIDGFVLFNRYYSPDIDIEDLKLTTSNPFSTPSDISTSLRWVALLSGSLQKDIAASTGVHNAEGVIKQILAGASAVQMVSAIYRNGAEYISSVLEDIEKWMEKKGYKSIEDFKGKLSFEQAKDSIVFERTQFMKYYGDIK